MTDLHLGYEIGTGHPVSIPIRNMVVTGQTQEAGKTTTLRALVSRAKTFGAVAFVTKRGEEAFKYAAPLDPYIRERADWQFVASILEATMRERMKFERSWIIQASKGAKTLKAVQTNVRKLLAKASGLSKGVYLTLDAYLDIVVPRLAAIEWGSEPQLGHGMNVMDLSDRELFPAEIQALVIRSVLESIYEHGNHTISILPEAWEFLPQSRGSPVKLAAIELIRKGSNLRNHVWLDSQDIGGVDKEILRSCPVWLLGVQREANEIKRTLANIPDNVAKPKAADIATLERGQFIACFGKTVKKVYVQPAWMHSSDAIDIAHHPERADEIATRAGIESVGLRVPKLKGETMKSETVPPSLLKEVQATNSKLDRLAGAIEKLVTPQIINSERPLDVQIPDTKERADLVAHTKTGNGDVDLQQIYEYVVDRLKREAPAIISVLAQVPEIEVREEKVIIETDLKAAQGMIAVLIHDGILDAPISGHAVWKEMQRRWDYGGNAARAYEQLDKLTSLGFLTKELRDGGKGYAAVAGMKKRIRRIEA